MRFNPPLKTHGGKGAHGGKLARWILSLMAPHTHYVEPYFGGGSVLLLKDPRGVSEVVNDLDGELINWWRVVQDEDRFPRFQRLVEAVPFGKPFWRAARDLLARRDEADPVKWAEASFRGGTVRACLRPGRDRRRKAGAGNG
jgi:DNA adenine methylase